MSGNVAEFCLDFYSPDTYKADTVAAVNPTGPVKDRNMLSGEDHLKVMQKMSEVLHAILQKQKHGWLQIRRCQKVSGGTPIVLMWDSG